MRATTTVLVRVDLRRLTDVSDESFVKDSVSRSVVPAAVTARFLALATVLAAFAPGVAPAREVERTARLAQATCQGAECLEQLGIILENALPDTVLPIMAIQARLRDELLRTAQFQLGAEATLRLDELEGSVRECREASAKLPPIRYGSAEDLQTMCASPAVIEARKKYDGISIPLPFFVNEKYDRKVAAQKAYHRKVAETLSGLLLARLAVMQSRLDVVSGKVGKDGKAAPLPFPVESCPNAQKGEFTYPYEVQGKHYENYRETLRAAGGLPDTGSLGPEGREQIIRDIALSTEALRSLCQDDLVSATAEHVQDPRMSMLMFNSPSFDPASPEGVVDQVTFCRYGDIKERIERFKSRLTWLYDGLTLGIGFLGPKGMALASVANVGLYGALAGQASIQAQKLREEYLAGVRSGVETVSEDRVTEAENKLVNTLLEAGIVTAFEGVAWGIASPAARAAGKTLLGLLRTPGAFAKMLAEGTLTLAADGLRFAGQFIPFKGLPGSAVSMIKRAFAYMGRLGLAQSAKVNVRLLADTIAELSTRFGAEMAQKFEKYIGQYGRKGLERYGCRVLGVLGPAASTGAWAYQGLR